MTKDQTKDSVNEATGKDKEGQGKTAGNRISEQQEKDKSGKTAGQERNERGNLKQVLKKDH